MAITFRGKGASGAGTTSFATAVPVGTAVGDGLVLVVGNKYPNNGPSTPTGWVAIANGQGSGGAGAAGIDSGTVYATAFFRTADGTANDAPTVSITSGNAAIGAIFGWSNGTLNWSVAAANGADNTAGTDWSVTYGTDPGITAGDALLVFNCTNGNTFDWGSARSLSVPGVTLGTLTTADVGGTSSGDDLLTYGARYIVSSGTSSGVATWTTTMAGTLANEPAGAGILIRLRELSTDVLMGAGVL